MVDGQSFRWISFCSRGVSSKSSTPAPIEEPSRKTYSGMPLPDNRLSRVPARTLATPMAISHTPISIITIKQDQVGNITKKTLREHNEVVEVSYFDYDENNNLIHIKTIDKKTDNVKEVFRNYDHHRNLTKETVLFNEVKIKEAYFEYEYYE